MIAPKSYSFLDVDCSVAGRAIDRMGNLVQVEVGAYTVASVQITIVSGARTNWIGNVRRLNSSVGVPVDFSTAVTMTAAGMTEPLDVAETGWLSFWHTAVDAGLKVDVEIRLSAP